MPTTSFNSIDDYIASKSEATRSVLQQVRNAIRTAVPAAEERISYRIPTYTLPAGVVVYFAGWKKHYSLYPANAELVETFNEELSPYEVNSKGTIRFPLSGPVPAELIGRIAKFRADGLTR